MLEISPINPSTAAHLKPSSSSASALSKTDSSSSLCISTAMSTQKELGRPKLDPPNFPSPTQKGSIWESPTQMGPPKNARNERLSHPSSSPTGLTEFRLFSLMEEFHSFGDGLLSSMTHRLEAFKSKLHEVSEENIKNIRVSAEKAKTSYFWSVLQKIATTLLSALSIVMGISLIATGGGALLGGAMVASGILSIANFVLWESGTWDWLINKLSNEDETRRHYLSIILPASFGIACAAISVFGAVGATLWTATTVMSKAAMIAQATLATFEGVTTIGKGHSNANLIWTQADLLSSSSQMTVEKHRIDHATQAIDSFLKELSAIQEQMAMSMRSIIASNQLVVPIHG